MSGNGPNAIIQEFQNFINEETYPCVAARAAMTRGHIPCLVADHMACPKDDSNILEFVYEFVKDYRTAAKSLHSAAIIFQQPERLTEEAFDAMLWQRLQALLEMDAQRFAYDRRVNSDPSARDFSFSLGEEAFFVIGLHPASERRSRKFKYPTIVFNPHAQFEDMRRENQYEKMKQIVRKRDILYSGSVNPMLSDFGDDSEVYQYSGRQYDNGWTCPLKVRHESTEHNPTSE